MLKIINGNDGDLILENEYSIRMKVIRRLAEIESEIKDPGYARRYSLKQQQAKFIEQLNEE